ncbi:MAG: hypothetical protein GY729_18760 [Desulfobacteraceae bacterium]|nr:hypothetical protein [Desulfobacteraceae bacterium]
MDFDSIITFFILIAFFVLPAILKKVKAGKKKTAPLKKTKKKLSIFDKLGEQVRQFAREIENQAHQQENASEGQSTVREMFAEDEDLLFESEKIGEDADFSDAPIIVTHENSETKEPEAPEKRTKPQKEVEEPTIGKSGLCLSKDYRYKSNPLQNAIILSEILSKPVALRDEY